MDGGGSSGGVVGVDVGMGVIGVDVGVGVVGVDEVMGCGRCGCGKWWGGGVGWVW